MKKINKGFILTIIVVVALTIYLRNVEKQREAEKPDIKKACEEFIEFTDKYSVLPEEMQKFEESISENQIEEYLKEMKAELEKLMIENEDAINLQFQAFKNNLINNNNEVQLVKNQKRTIVIDEYEFNGNQVTVKCYNKLRMTVKSLIGTEEKIENNEFNASEDEIVLQKINGEWKIIYSNLKFNGNSIYYDRSDEVIF